MKVKYLLLVICSVFVSIKAFTQETFGIIFNAQDRDQKCKPCTRAFNKRSNGVRYAIKEMDGYLYLSINDRDWFNNVFKNPDDGIAIDIVSKTRYKCSLESINKTQIKGHLLKPIYAQELKQGLRQLADNIYKVKLGKVPNHLLNQDVEYNILLIGNKNLCQYLVTYDLDYYSWDLLDMGMYLDDLTYDVKKIQSTDKAEYVVKNKKLKFIIPFKKNKSKYSQASIKPLYDSLRLTNYDIVRLNIKAYSSIEGISKRNFELQEERANSVVNALQTYQKPTIKTTVSTSDNWVEFFNDIEGTKFEYLNSCSKNEVKEAIAGAVSREMEYILENHRKAVVELELEHKEKNNKATSLILAEFNKAITQRQWEVANTKQNSIFKKIDAGEESVDVLQKMNIPRQAKYAEFLIKNAAYKYMLDDRDALNVHAELLDIQELVPNNTNLKYNILAIELLLWRYNALDIEDSKLLKKIRQLEDDGIPESLVSRMLVNYNMVLAHRLMRAGDFDKKDKRVFYVDKNHKNFPLSDYDYSSLAQFFSIYGNSDLAAKLLGKKARTIDIDEDLLFYYLNLTLVNKTLTKKLDYRTIMLNAINMNKTRFCNLFNSVENGGVTFQLLEDDYLRETFCENCKD